MLYPTFMLLIKICMFPIRCSWNLRRYFAFLLILIVCGIHCYTHVDICQHTYNNTYIYRNIYMYMYIYTRVYIYIYTYVCIYIYILFVQVTLIVAFIIYGYVDDIVSFSSLLYRKWTYLYDLLLPGRSCTHVWIIHHIFTYHNIYTYIYIHVHI